MSHKVAERKKKPSGLSKLCCNGMRHKKICSLHAGTVYHLLHKAMSEDDVCTYMLVVIVVVVIVIANIVMLKIFNVTTMIILLVNNILTTITTTTTTKPAATTIQSTYILYSTWRIYNIVLL